eukprot:15070-Amphidinium_carterae.1
MHKAFVLGTKDSSSASVNMESVAMCKVKAPKCTTVTTKVRDSKKKTPLMWPHSSVAQERMANNHK